MTTYAPEYLDLVRDRAAGRVTEAFRREIAGLVGEGGLISEPAQLRTYECDGITGYRVVPALVVLPATTEEVAAVVRVCARERVPFVARGAGTGLSGGALPVADGIVIGLARMRRILDIDVAEPAHGRRARRHQRRHLRRGRAQHDLYFAPDPSSQTVCTIGGNVAENSGGAHCLKYGFTTNHVYALDGRAAPTGASSRSAATRLDAVGPDLRGVFIGSEGTLGIVTRSRCGCCASRRRCAPWSPTSRTRSRRATRSAASSPPASSPPRWRCSTRWPSRPASRRCMPATPSDAGAALVVELDGPEAEVRRRISRGSRRSAGRRRHEDPDRRRPGERARVWKGRKAAFAAMGRISPDYYVQDGVIPRTRLRRGPDPDRQDGATRRGCGWPTSSTPATATCTRSCSTTPRCRARPSAAEHLSTAIAELCVELGGSITGEHGVGTDKACSMPKMFTEDDLDRDGRGPRARSTRTGSATPARSSPRRACAAKGRANTARTRSRPPGVIERLLRRR